MDEPRFKAGDVVERRYGHGEHRVGRIVGRVREGYDTWYVNTDVGMTFCDSGRDLRRAEVDPTDAGSSDAGLI